MKYAKFTLAEVEGMLRRAAQLCMKRYGSLKVHTMREALKDLREPIQSETYVIHNFGISWASLKSCLEQNKPLSSVLPAVAQQVKEGDTVALSETAESDVPVEVSGVEAWGKLKDRFSKRIDEVEMSSSRVVNIKTEKPVGIVFLGDLHIGSASTDYPRLEYLLNLFSRKDIDVYTASIGDVLDSMIWRNVMVERHKTPIDVPEEIFAATYWLEQVVKAGRLVGVVAGNHDLISWRMTGFSHLDAVMLQLSKKIPYHPFEMLLTVNVGDVPYRVLLRHKVKGGSELNPAHGVSKHHMFDYFDSDIIVAGHTHRSGVQERMLKGKTRWGIQVGAFKRSEYDDYAIEQGFAWENLNPDYMAILWPKTRKIQVLPTETGVQLLEAYKREASGTSSVSLPRLKQQGSGKAAASIKSTSRTRTQPSSSAKASQPSSKNSSSRKTKKSPRNSTK